MVMVMVLVMVMMVVVVAMVEVVKKASPSKLSLKWKVPIKHALLGKVIKSQFPSARIRCSDLDLKQLGCVQGSVYPKSCRPYVPTPKCALQCWLSNEY